MKYLRAVIFLPIILSFSLAPREQDGFPKIALVFAWEEYNTPITVEKVARYDLIYDADLFHTLGDQGNGTGS